MWFTRTPVDLSLLPTSKVMLLFDVMLLQECFDKSLQDGDIRYFVIITQEAPGAHDFLMFYHFESRFERAACD